jgi:hypothetical protein
MSHNLAGLYGLLQGQLYSFFFYQPTFKPLKTFFFAFPLILIRLQE